MSQRLKQYLNDVFDGKHMSILEMSKDPNLENRYQSMIKTLNITDKQTLERCMKIIASESLKPPMKDGHIVSLILFSMELDSYHSINSNHPTNPGSQLQSPFTYIPSPSSPLSPLSVPLVLPLGTESPFSRRSFLKASY